MARSVIASEAQLAAFFIHSCEPEHPPGLLQTFSLRSGHRP